MKCLNCGSENVAVLQKTNGFSFAGVVAALLFLIGLGALLMAPLIGLLIIITALILGIFGRGKSNYFVCLDCRTQTKI